MYQEQVRYCSVPGWCPHCQCMYSHHDFMCNKYHVKCKSIFFQHLIVTFWSILFCIVNISCIFSISHFCSQIAVFCPIWSRQRFLYVTGVVCCFTDAGIGENKWGECIQFERGVLIQIGECIQFDRETPVLSAPLQLVSARQNRIFPRRIVNNWKVEQTSDNLDRWLSKPDWWDVELYD